MKWSESVRTRKKPKLQLPDKVLRLIVIRTANANARQLSVEQRRWPARASSSCNS